MRQFLIIHIVSIATYYLKNNTVSLIKLFPRVSIGKFYYTTVNVVFLVHIKLLAKNRHGLPENPFVAAVFELYKQNRDIKTNTKQLLTSFLLNLKLSCKNQYF